MKENAILVRHIDVQKIYVDFSNVDNIYDALDADRVSTIHTAKTQELSAKLGFHIMGFVDREGSDINNRLASAVSGYDYLGSFMLLCKADDNLNALPLSSAELDSLYLYLTKGEEKNVSFLNEDPLGLFLREYNINPPLPDFGVKPEIVIYNNGRIKHAILLTYDLNALGDRALEKAGENLFRYSSILLEKFDNVGDDLVSKDKKYFLRNRYLAFLGKYFIAIQVITDDQPKSKIAEIFMENMII